MTNDNPKIPHQSVICVTIYYELCENQPDGRVGTKVKDTHTESLAFTVRGSTLEECRESTKTFLEELKARINDRV